MKKERRYTGNFIAKPTGELLKITKTTPGTGSMPVDSVSFIFEDPGNISLQRLIEIYIVEEGTFQFSDLDECLSWEEEMNFTVTRFVFTKDPYFKIIGHGIDYDKTRRYTFDNPVPFIVDINAYPSETIEEEKAIEMVKKKKHIKKIFKDKQLISDVLKLVGVIIDPANAIKIRMDKRGGIEIVYEKAVLTNIGMDKHVLKHSSFLKSVDVIFLFCDWTFDEIQYVKDFGDYPIPFELLRINPFLNDEVKLWIEMK